MHIAGGDGACFLTIFAFNNGYGFVAYPIAFDA